MGTTARLSLPYPEPSDKPEGDLQIKALAEKIDGLGLDTVLNQPRLRVMLHQPDPQVEYTNATYSGISNTYNLQFDTYDVGYVSDPSMLENFTYTRGDGVERTGTKFVAPIDGVYAFNSALLVTGTSIPAAAGSLLRLTEWWVWANSQEANWAGLRHEGKLNLFQYNTQLTSTELVLRAGEYISLSFNFAADNGTNPSVMTIGRKPDDLKRERGSWASFRWIAPIPTAR